MPSYPCLPHKAIDEGAFSVLEFAHNQRIEQTGFDVVCLCPQGGYFGIHVQARLVHNIRISPHLLDQCADFILGFSRDEYFICMTSNLSSRINCKPVCHPMHLLMAVHYLRYKMVLFFLAFRTLNMARYVPCRMQKSTKSVKRVIFYSLSGLVRPLSSAGLG